MKIFRSSFFNDMYIYIIYVQHEFSFLTPSNVQTVHVGLHIYSWDINAWLLVLSKAVLLNRTSRFSLQASDLAFLLTEGVLIVRHNRSLIDYFRRRYERLLIMHNQLSRANEKIINDK